MVRGIGVLGWGGGEKVREELVWVEVGVYEEMMEGGGEGVGRVIGRGEV